MNIGIIGLGVVGNALAKCITFHAPHHKLYCYDPLKGLKDDLKECSVVFLCVPVPTVNYAQDLTAIMESIKLIPNHADIIIRSTVLPGTCDRLAKEYGRDIYAMPEFLTERRAVDDMLRLPILTGYSREEILKSIFPGKNIIQVTNSEAEMIKYVHNCYLAQKVNFFNIIHELCEHEKIDFANVVDNLGITGFINRHTHTLVPGPDGKYGFGGKCFPKDLDAFWGWSYGKAVNNFESISLCNKHYREK